MSGAELSLVKFTWSDFDTYNKENEEKFKIAFRQGFFRIALPDHHRPLIAKTMQFAEKIREQAKEGKFNDLNVERHFGYHLNPGQQSVRLSLEKENWESVYPELTRQLGKELEDISIKILENVLTFFKIPQDKWTEVTAQVTAKQGSTTLAMTNYEPDSEKTDIDKPAPIGARPHKDTGFLTVLYNDKKGLYALVEEENKKVWKPVSVDTDCYIINFGITAETFFNSPELKAVEHKVTAIFEKRQSFIVLIQPKATDFVYRRQSDGSFKPFKKCSELVEQFFEDYMQ